MVQVIRGDSSIAQAVLALLEKRRQDALEQRRLDMQQSLLEQQNKGAQISALASL